MSLALFVHHQLETKSKRSRQIDKFHQKAQVVSTYKLVPKKVLSKAIPNIVIRGLGWFDTHIFCITDAMSD
jgi:hypothetical protein